MMIPIIPMVIGDNAGAGAAGIRVPVIMKANPPPPMEASGEAVEVQDVLPRIVPPSEEEAAVVAGVQADPLIAAPADQVSPVAEDPQEAEEEGRLPEEAAAAGVAVQEDISN